MWCQAASLSCVKHPESTCGCSMLDGSFDESRSPTRHGESSDCNAPRFPSATLMRIQGQRVDTPGPGFYDPLQQQGVGALIRSVRNPRSVVQPFGRAPRFPLTSLQFPVGPGSHDIADLIQSGDVSPVFGRKPFGRFAGTPLQRRVPRVCRGRSFTPDSPSRPSHSVSEPFLRPRSQPRKLVEVEPWYHIRRESSIISRPSTSELIAHPRLAKTKAALEMAERIETVWKQVTNEARASRTGKHPEHRPGASTLQTRVLGTLSTSSRSTGGRQVTEMHDSLTTTCISVTSLSPPRHAAVQQAAAVPSAPETAGWAHLGNTGLVHTPQQDDPVALEDGVVGHCVARPQ